MKYKFRLKKRKSCKYVIQKKNWFFYETLFATKEFNHYQECVDYIYDNYDKNYCEIKYDKEW